MSAGAKPVLALDTGTPVASLALFAGGRIVAHRTRPTTSRGAALPNTVAELLREAHLGLRDLGAVAVGIGPGSFTGLRVGLSYAKGVALATGCALAGIPSLDATALETLETHVNQAPIGAEICAIIDARKGEVYRALYRVVSNGLEKRLADAVIPVGRLGSELGESPILVGDATANDAATVMANRGQRVVVVDRQALDRRARTGALLGAARLALGDTDRIHSLEPLYVRPPDAVRPASAPAAQEGVWSAERKNSSGSM
ncbi:MAG TPA: tRNA (adenosine(37)-N6)-threonylcarbamoyltransferase complex dimerization subunit type 1 TsaB [Candidatus Binataceae bacterium]|nr:tRNA (adenosine(37)-N6)-threonylcarbamoyltransferase complex dimerization subunit type 1 TsaB [Candidatus Binataceae bacterium]